METATFTYLGAKCVYNFETKNLHIISKQSFNSTKRTYRFIISKKHNIEKKDIKTITFKHPNTKLPSNIYYYFLNYPNLEYIELEKLDFENVETINGFIYNCPKLKEITITHKNAENLIFIRNFIVETQDVTSITIKHINASNLQEISWLLCDIKKDIEKITIEDITSPNIKSIDYLIHNSPIKALDLTKIGNINVTSIKTLIKNCNQLETLKLNPLTNTKEIGIFIQQSPVLKTEIISKIDKIEKLDAYFLTMTPKNEVLDLNKFEDIDELRPHLKRNTYDKINRHQYTGIKIGKHKMKIIDYAIILTYNIPIQDKTEEEIVKEIITQSRNETKKAIDIFLNILKTKETFKNEKYKNELASKLTIIKNLK